MILGQWYAVLATFISFADKNGISLACNQYILFFICCDAFSVNMDTLPSSAVMSTLIKYVGNYSNMSASAALLDSCRNVSLVTYLPLHAPPLATPTFLADTYNISRPNSFLSF